MNYSSFKIFVGTIEDNTCQKLSLGFKRFFSMLLMIGCLISGTLEQSLFQNYVPLLPGQHFYAKAMMGTSGTDGRVSYGGWFQGIETSLKLSDMAVNLTALSNANWATVVQYKFTAGRTLSILPNTWVFVMWNTVCTGTMGFLNPMNASTTHFCKMNLEGAFSTHYLTTPAAVTDKDIAPIYFGDADLNGTSFFEVNPYILRQSGLFYATTSNLSALFERMPQYMLGPYKGLKRGHKGFKFNIGITSLRIYSASLRTLDNTYTTKTLQKSMVDTFGTYVPVGKFIEYADYFNPTINQWTSEPDNIRSFYIQWRMRRNVAFATTTESDLTLQCNHSMLFTLNPYPLDFFSSDLTIVFTIQRVSAKAWCIVKSAANVFYEVDVSGVFQSTTTDYGVLFSMKIAMVLVQNATEQNMSSPLFNIIIEFISREGLYEVIKRVLKVFPSVKVPFNPFGGLTGGVTHMDTSNTTGILSVYLNDFNEVRGGYWYTSMGYVGHYVDIPDCLSTTVILNGSEMSSYCQICSVRAVLDNVTGLCTSDSNITNRNTTCERWVTKDMCNTCSHALYWISQVQRICTPNTDPCSDSTVDLSFAFDPRNMLERSCNDVKYYDSATGCTQYSNPVPGGTTCTCDVSFCKTCLHTPCDECLSYFRMVVNGSSVTCLSTMAPQPAGYGPDSDDSKYLKPCLVPNCQDCLAGYKICRQCSTPYELDIVLNHCVLCRASDSRYWNATSKTCTPVGCPTNTWLRTVDGQCTNCQPAANDKYIAPNGTEFGTILTGSVCVLCSYSCATCLTESSCVDCRVGMYKYISNNTCGSCTEPGWYITGSYCNKCNLPCTGCNGPSMYSCTSCDTTINNFLFADGSCKICNVTNGYYYYNRSCLQCHTSCLTCANETDTGCLTCKANLFLNVDSDGTCGTCSQPGFYKDFGATAKCRKCDPACQGCTGNLPSNCITCASGYLLATNGTCMPCNTSGPYFLNNGSCLDCHASCATCNGSSNSSCTSCHTNNFLGDDKTCTTCTVPGYYKDSSNLALPRCKKCDASCLECNGSLSTNCLACPTGKYLPASSCPNCSKTSTNCTECDTANGYILVNGSCVIQGASIYLQCKSVSVTSADIALSFVITPPESSTASLTQSVWRSLNISAVWNSNVPGELLLYPSNSALRVDVKGMFFPESFPKTVTLDVSWPAAKITEGSIKIEKGACFSQYEKGPSQEQIKSAENQAAVVSGLTSTMSSTDSAVGMSLMGTLLAADPTGTFFRFTKILQIVNKLYFININYGKRLEAFLAKTSLVGNTELPIENIKKHRGKLDQHKVTLDFVAAMSDKVVLYLISWILKGVKRLLLDNCIMGKIGIYFCHYANRAHLIIFNLVFIDFIWLAPRTLMHARGLSGMKDCIAILVMCLIAADLCLILSHLLDDRIWRKALEHYTSLKEFCPIPETSSKDKSNQSSLQALNEPGSAPKQDDPNQDQTKQINYKKTYFEIDFNVHLMDMATNTLRVDESVFQSSLCRILMTAIWWRVILIQLTILSCQYANTLGLTVLLIIELSRLFATIYAYLKYKYLKNIICLLMEVLNCFSVGLFFLNALLISPKRFDELIMDFYQDAGIWIVIASCVAEYLLLLTYIGVATYDFFKNRKMMKRMNVHHREYSFMAVKYVKKPESRNANETSTFTDQNKDSSGLTLTNTAKATPKIKSRLKAQNRVKKGLRPSKNGVEPLFKSIHFKPL